MKQFLPDVQRTAILKLEVIYMSFHKKLKEERVRKELSQEELAKMLNISRQSISKWERKEGYPNIETLIDLSYLLEISLDELLKSDVDLKEKIIKDSKELKYPRLKMFSDILYFIGIIVVISTLPLFLFSSVSAIVLIINGILISLIGFIGKYFVDENYVS